MNASVDAAETSGCTASGSVDSSFGIGGVAGPTFGFVPGTAAVAEDVVIDDQQRIVVAGGFASGPRACLVTRYLTSGVLDQSFGAGGTSRIGGGSSSACWFNAVALQADQKIVAAGSIDGHTFARAILARFLPDGDLDPDFGDGGIVLADSSSETVIMGVVVDDAQRIVVAQESSDWQHQPLESHFMTMRYLSDGTLDSSFGSGGVGANAFANGQDAPGDVGVDASGKIVVVGQAATAEFEQVKFGAVRYTDDGSLDPSFATGGTVEIQFDQPSGATGLAFDPLGHLVIAGSSGEWGALVRLTSDGVMDPAFGDGGTQIETAKEMGLSGTALDTAGRIVVLGTESIGQLGIARFTSAGVVDTSFGAMGFGEALPLAGWRQIAWDLAIQADGRIVVVGEYGDLTTGDFLVARYCP